MSHCFSCVISLSASQLGGVCPPGEEAFGIIKDSLVITPGKVLLTQGEERPRT